MLREFARWHLYAASGITGRQHVSSAADSDSLSFTALTRLFQETRAPSSVSLSTVTSVEQSG